MRLASKSLLAAGLSATLLLTGAGPVAAQYIWKDSQGQVHASDLPPPREVPDKDLLKRPSASGRQTPAPPTVMTAPSSAASSSNLLTKPPTDPELEARRKLAETEARARARADDERLAAQRAENCRRARQQLASLDSGQRLVRHDDKGERMVVDDTVRAEEAQAARRVIASDCR